MRAAADGDDEADADVHAELALADSADAEPRPLSESRLEAAPRLSSHSLAPPCSHSVGVRARAPRAPRPPASTSPAALGGDVRAKPDEPSAAAATLDTRAGRSRALDALPPPP